MFVLKFLKNLTCKFKLEENKVAERADRLRQEFERRMHPQTKGDFDLLYAALESIFFSTFCLKNYFPSFLYILLNFLFCILFYSIFT